MKRRVILYGASGHAKVIADMVLRSKEFVLEGFVDDDKTKKGMRILDYPVLGQEEYLRARAGEKSLSIVIAIGKNNIRALKAAMVESLGFPLVTLVHPNATVAQDVVMESGTVVMAGAVINSGSRLSKNVIINTCASIDHDCIVGDTAHVSPGVRLAGNVRVGKEVHIGIGASVIPNVRIGDRAVIGAGAVVIRDVPGAKTFVGVPAKQLVNGKRHK